MTFFLLTILLNIKYLLSVKKHAHCRSEVGNLLAMTWPTRKRRKDMVEALEEMVKKMRRRNGGNGRMRGTGRQVLDLIAGGNKYSFNSQKREVELWVDCGGQDALEAIVQSDCHPILSICLVHPLSG